MDDEDDSDYLCDEFRGYAPAHVRYWKRRSYKSRKSFREAFTVNPLPFDVIYMFLLMNIFLDLFVLAFLLFLYRDDHSECRRFWMFANATVCWHKQQLLEEVDEQNYRQEKIDRLQKRVKNAAWNAWVCKFEKFPGQYPREKSPDRSEFGSDCDYEGGDPTTSTNVCCWICCAWIESEFGERDPTSSWSVAEHLAFAEPEVRQWLRDHLPPEGGRPLVRTETFDPNETVRDNVRESYMARRRRLKRSQFNADRSFQEAVRETIVRDR